MLLADVDELGEPTLRCSWNLHGAVPILWCPADQRCTLFHKSADADPSVWAVNVAMPSNNGALFGESFLPVPVTTAARCMWQSHPSPGMTVQEIDFCPLRRISVLGGVVKAAWSFFIRKYCGIRVRIG